MTVTKSDYDWDEKKKEIDYLVIWFWSEVNLFTLDQNQISK